MYNDANLPETEAWTALTRDLREAKDSRNNLEKENACVLFVLRSCLAAHAVLQETQTRARRSETLA